MEKYLKFSIELARKVGRDILLRNYNAFQIRHYKSLTDFKTQVDDMADRFIRERIAQTFPDHNMFSEEGDDIKQGSQYTWVCDPLDGTVPYTKRISDGFSVSISLVKGKKPVVGAIYFPKREELFYAQDGKGAFCNGKRIHVSDETQVNRALIGFEVGKEKAPFHRTSSIPYLHKLMTEEGITYFFTHGSFTFTSSLASRGNLDAVLGIGQEPWDMAAAVVINREAGARVTNLENKKWTLDDNSVLIANPTLHKKFINFLNI